MLTVEEAASLGGASKAGPPWWGVWLTDVDGGNGRWLTDGPPDLFMTQDRDYAEQSAAMRRPLYPHVIYTVKPFDG